MTERESDPREPGDVVQFERRDHALWIWLNRPAVLNALSHAVLDRLEKALAQAREDDDIRCLVIAARGRAFCAGSDLSLIQALNTTPAEGDAGLRTDQQDFIRRVGSVFNAIEALPMPVIAAVQGLAVAGGLELALCCDLVVAAESATFGDGHANYGLVPGAGGSIRLPRRVGSSLAKRMLFTGDQLTAGELEYTDLITQVVADADLVTAVDALVARMAQKSPLSIRLGKRLIHDGVQVPLDVALRMEVDACELNAQSHDLREGLDAFVNKREPRFLGR